MNRFFMSKSVVSGSGTAVLRVPLSQSIKLSAILIKQNEQAIDGGGVSMKIEQMCSGKEHTDRTLVPANIVCSMEKKRGGSYMMGKTLPWCGVDLVSGDAIIATIDAGDIGGASVEILFVGEKVTL